MKYSEKNTEVTLKVNGTAYIQAQQVCEAMGLDVDTAVNMMLVQMAQEKALPLDLNKRTTPQNPVLEKLEENQETNEHPIVEEVDEDFGWIQ